MSAYKRILKKLSKKLTKLSDKKLIEAHKRATNNFLNGNNASIYIIQMIESELKKRGIVGYNTFEKLKGKTT